MKDTKAMRRSLNIPVNIYLRVRRCFEAKKRMGKIMFVQSHITMCTKIEIEASSTLPPHAHDSVLSTRITDNVRMTNTDRRIVVHPQIVGRLVSNAIAKQIALRFARSTGVRLLLCARS